MDTTIRTSPLVSRPKRVAMAAVAAALAGGIIGVPRSALAHGGTEVLTTTFRDVTESATNTDPCTGVRETLTLTQTGVFHTTQHADGHYQTGGTVTGHFTATPVDPTRPTFTGRFTVRFSQRDNASSDTAQFNNTIRAVGSDGSTRNFHMVTHITASSIDFSTEGGQPVDVKIAFEKSECS
jgi:hypothetical protein